jgi:hypothetical protein
MADVKITALPLSGTLVPASDPLPIVNGGNTTQTTPAAIVTAALNATPVTPSQGGTGLTALGTGVATFLGTPSAVNLKAAVTDDTGSGALVFATSPTLVTPTLGAATATTVLTGATASLTDFPNAKVIGSTDNTGNTHSYNIGVVGEALASSSDANIWGVGVYGVGASNGATRSAGVVGDGSVVNATDAGSAVGVRGYSTDTHTGGANIGLYTEASGSTTANYALYMNAGNIYSNNTQTWTLGGNLTFAGGRNIITSGDILPSADNTISLGSASLRWNSVHIGPGSLFLQDTNDAGLNVEITVTDGVLLVNGSTTFQVGNIRITDPTPGNPTIAAINGDPLYLNGDIVSISDTAATGRLTVGQGGIAMNSDATNVTVTDGTIKLEGANVPAHSYGVAGDEAGMVAFNQTYMYYCTANYVNTSTDIWKRIAWSGARW